MQASHAAAPAIAWNFPKAHDLQELADAAEYWPTAHVLHAVELTAAEYEPAGHAVHAPTISTYVPAAHDHGDKNDVSHAALGS